ncbi:MAG: DUF4249 domain-containing protein [Dysgonamonadaceae bacterium]|jgi:hypothetical protein|nr:DUF4249 domain-containing protein [Dysgonamonadaceae bacterium]
MKQICNIFLAILLLSACTERIDIHTDEAAPKLVIYGKISTDHQRQVVNITRSTGYFADGKPEGVHGAEVEVTSSGRTYHFSYAGNGNYVSDANFSGEEGETYQLQVRLDFDEDGIQETYEASSYLPHRIRIDDIRIVPSRIFDQLIEIQLSADLPEKKDGIANGYNLHFYHNDRALNDSLKNFSTFSDEYINTRRLDTLTCYYISEKRDDVDLMPQDIIKVRVEVITRDYLEFITDAQNEISGSMPLFGGPPANVRTNIRCREKNMPVMGFFTAFSVDEIATMY